MYNDKMNKFIILSIAMGALQVSQNRQQRRFQDKTIIKNQKKNKNKKQNKNQIQNQNKNTNTNNKMSKMRKNMLMISIMPFKIHNI